MSQTDDEKLFAFGDNVLRGVGCPAVEAGLVPNNNDPVMVVADKYDIIVATRLDEESPDVNCVLRSSTGAITSGCISEALAKECWLEAIRIKKRRYAEDDLAIQQAEAVASELGWM